MTMMMIAQGAGKAFKAGSRLLQPKFQNTRFGRLLRERSREGNLSQAQEKNILDKVGTTAGRNAQVARNRYIGSAINRGMRGSVAVQRGLREAEADVRRTVTDTARGISAREERAKSSARENYARAMDRDANERRNAVLGTIGSVAETAGNIYGAKAQKAQSRNQSYLGAMSKFGQENFSERFDPDTGQSIGFVGGDGLTPDNRRQLEMYAQKTNIADASGVTNAFKAIKSGELDADTYRKQLKKGPNPLTDEQIDKFFEFLAGLGN